MTLPPVSDLPSSVTLTLAEREALAAYAGTLLLATLLLDPGCFEEYVEGMRSSFGSDPRAGRAALKVLDKLGAYSQTRIDR